MARRSLALVAVAAASAALAAPAQATFPGRNGEIVLARSTSSQGPRDGTVFAINPRSGVSRKLWECESNPVRPVPDCDAITTPAVSPDGRTTALVVGTSFYTGSPHEWTLYLIDSANSAARPIATPAELDFLTDQRGRTLRWKPDGSALTAALRPYVYLGSEPFTNRTVYLDGGVGPSLGPAGALELDWSIDGRAAFTYRGNLFVLDPDGTQRRLTLRGATQPSWSPHGRWIAFTRKNQVWMIASRGGKPSRLTRRGGFWPVWSPNGRRIAFVRARGEVGHLYAIDPRGGRARRISEEEILYTGDSSTVVLDSPPEWQALPR